MKLTDEENEFISSRESMIDILLENIEAVKGFRVGDYVVAHYKECDSNIKIPWTNSYGIARKFIVVYVDKYGVPFIKQLNSKGLPIGDLISILEYSWDSYERGLLSWISYELEVDPNYADALILDDVDTFNASAEHQEKSSLYKEIAKHNKVYRIDLSGKDLCLKFVKQLTVGDVLWRSAKTSWIVSYIGLVSPGGYVLTGHKRGSRISDTYNITFTDNKGKQLFYNQYALLNKVLYSQQPRTFNELKDPKL